MVDGHSRQHETAIINVVENVNMMRERFFLKDPNTQIELPEMKKSIK